MEELIRERLEDTINNATPDEADLPDGVTVQIQFGGVTFSVTDLAGQTGEVNDPSSSNDDLIDVDISINWAFTWNTFFGGAAAIGTMHIHLLLMFPQDAPSEVHPTRGHRCKYARRVPGATQYELIGVLPRCEDQSPPIEGCDAFWYYLEPLRQYWDASFYHDVDHPERADWLDAAQTGRYLSPTEFLPNGCMYSYLEPCEFLAPRVPEAENHRGSLCHTCVRPQYTFHEFNVPFSAFPGVWAVEVSYSDVPYFPYADIERRVRESLQEEGLLDVEILGQHWSGGCALQEQIAPAIDPMLDAPVDDSLPLTLRELIRQSGGVRVSDTTQSINLLIPPVQPANPISGAPMDDPDCTPRGVHYAGLEPGSMAELASRVMDFPKVAQHLLSSDATAVNLGLHVVCDQGLDCEANGYTDSDGDGFCDAWVQGGAVHYDHCPDAVTGVNCDSDHDGFGDGHSFIWAVCGPVDPTHASYEEKMQESFRRQRQFYCGGCDNCQWMFNPQTYHPGFDGHVGLTASWSPTDAVLTLPTSQYDLDNDWLGDACDPDIDGDGVTNDWDCHEKNQCLGPDLDQDGVCEYWSADPSCQTAGLTREQVCISQCSAMWERHGQDTEYFNYSRCYQQCALAAQGFDNCAPADPATDPYCGAVVATCANPLPTEPCDASAAERCTRRYANPRQESTFGDPLVGDKCKTGIGSLTLSPDYGGGTGAGGGLPLTLSCDRYGDTYSVNMRLWGGDVVETPDGQARYQAEDRTAVEVGVCSCPPGPVDGWDSLCVRDECPYRAELVGQYDTKAWNPVSAPEIAVKRYVPSEGFQPVYPVYCGDPWDPCDSDHVSAMNHQLVFGRKMPFTRDPGQNAHRLTWTWYTAKQFPQMTALGVPYGTAGRTTRARAAWPNFSESYLDPFYDTQVSYSQAVPVGSSLNNCRGVVYLGPAFILNRIPGVVDLFPDDRARTARIPGGWLLGEEAAEGRPLLYRLAPGTLHVDAVQELQLPEGADLLAAPTASHVGLLPSSLLGSGEAGMTLALAHYSPGGPAPPPQDPPTHQEDPAPAGAARLLLGSLESGLVVALTDVAARTGVPTPRVEDAQVVLLPQRGQVLLLGRDPSGLAAPIAYRLRLEEGAWSGPHALTGLGDRRGFSLVRDAYGDRLLVFGGNLGDAPVTGGPTTGGAESADLFSLDPDTLIARRLPFDAPEGAARRQAGLFMHGEGRQLYVMGGEQSGTPLATGFVIDLRRGTATNIDLSAGPGAVTDPFVYYDDQEARLWVADLAGASTAEGLSLWALDQEGAWQAMRTFVGPEASSFPVQASFLAGRASVYFVEAPASAAWPGQVFLASLQSSGAQVRLSAQSAAADLLCESTGQDTDLEQAAFACPPESSCRLALSLGATDEWTGAAVPFTLDVREAALGPAESRLLPVPATDLSLHRGSLVVTSPLGLGLMDAATLEWTGLATGPGMVAAQAVTPCGSHHCVARLGPEGLKVLDLSDPASPEVKGSALTLGLGWDVAASGAGVFVAHGVLGVGVYELGPAGQAYWRQSLFQGGILRSVAAIGGVLAAARQDGKIHLYRLGESIQAAASLRAPGPIDRVRFVGGLLWVLSRKQDRVDVYSVADPDAPAHLGGFTQDAARAFRTVWHVPRTYSFNGPNLEVRRAEAVQP